VTNSKTAKDEAHSTNSGQENVLQICDWKPLREGRHRHRQWSTGIILEVRGWETAFWIQLAQDRVKRRRFSTAVTYSHLRVAQNEAKQLLHNENDQRATSFQTNPTGRHSR